MRNFIQKEMGRIKNDRVYLALIFFAPILSLVLLASIYKNEIIRDIPVAVVDLDNSVLSRKVAFYIDSSPSMMITKRCKSVEEVEMLIKGGDVQAGFIFPQDMEKDVKTNKLTSVTVLKNTINIVTSNVLLKDASTIIKTVSGGITVKKLLAAGNGQDKAIAMANPVEVHSSPLFNSNYSYEQFLVPGLFLFFIQISLMLSGVMAFNRNRFEKIHSFAELLYKSGLHLALGMVFQIVSLLVILPAFSIPLTGNYFQIFFMFGLFSIASFLPGAAISLFIDDLQTAAEYVMFFNTPAFIFSGLTFPLWSMPALHRIFAEIIPLTHFMEAFIRFGFMDLTPDYYSIQTLKLFGFVLIPAIVIAYKLSRDNNSTGVPENV